MKLSALVGRNLSLAFVSATLVILGACFVKQEDKLNVPMVAQPLPTKASEVGRFQMVMHPEYRADKFLIDTVDGRIWQYSIDPSKEGEPAFLKRVPRESINTTDDELLDRFVEIKTPKKKSK